MLWEWNSDVMLFSETWLQPHCTVNSHLALPNFSLFRRDRIHRSHGGLVLYVNDHLCPRRRIDLEADDIECIVLELSKTIPKQLFFCCYRPPDQSPELFFSTLFRLLSAADTDSTILNLIGDFNAKHSSWDSDSLANVAGSKMFDLMLDFCFSQLVHTSTRFSADGNSSSVLDLFATTRPDLVLKTEVTDPISDHCCVNTQINIRSRLSPKQVKRISLPDFERADWVGFRANLAQTPLLAAVQGTSDINIAWKVWHNIFLDKAARFVPSRYITLRPNNARWMTSDLHKLSRQKHRLFAAAKRSHQAEDWDRYRQARNRCTAEFQKAKTAYVRRTHAKLRDEADGSHRWWRLAKSLARITNPTVSIPDMSDNGIALSSENDKADLLARFFARQCTDANPQADTCGAPFPLSPSHPRFEFPPITEQLTLRRLQRLPIHKATADKLITNRMLRECAPFICSSLTYLFNLSLSTSTFPLEWKHAVVTPLFKQRGSPNDATNYRPVSLLPAIGKLLDAMLSERLLSYLQRNGIISCHQYGFLPRRSTTMQLVYIVHRWLKAMEDGDRTHAVFMDFMKAFDRVWHHGLLHKLKQIGLTSDSIELIRSYLSHRTISVRVGATLSRPHTITAGVPQGSHLGPVLFLVFINDLPSHVGIPTELYADDAVLHHQTKSSDITSLEPLQTAVSHAEQWALSWNGRFGHAKTKLLVIRARNQQPAILPSSVLIEESPIEVVVSHRHLGVILTDNLQWRTHISSIICSCSKRAGLLRWMANDLPQDAAVRLYLHYVRPLFEYASPVWHGSLSEQEATALERIQAAVARRLLGAAWDTPKTELLQRLEWPSLRWRREIQGMVLFHQLLLSRPPPLSDCLFPFSHTKVSRSQRKPFQLLLPNVKTNRFLKSFFFRSSLLWNSLPHCIQSLTSSPQFKQALQDHWRAHKFNTHTNIPVR